jgi:glutathione-regulated potassium-efflux system ancillary protein KefF
MKKVTIIFAHPFIKDSVANKEIISYIKKVRASYDIRNLYEIYPDFNIDVKKEQEQLIHSDVIVLQFPFFWYSVPAMMKQWIDMVFEHGFAFGTNGDKLKGKHLIVSMTIGGKKESYTPLGYNHFRICDFMKMFEQMAYLTQMHYEEPIYEHGMRTIGGGADVGDVRKRAENQAKRLIDAIERITE